MPELEAARELMVDGGRHRRRGLALEQLAEIRLYAADSGGAVELLRQASPDCCRPGEAAGGVNYLIAHGLGHALVRLGEYGEAHEVVSDVLETRSAGWTGRRSVCAWTCSAGRHSAWVTPGHRARPR